GGLGPRDRVHAVYVIGRIGDSRVLPALHALESKRPDAALRVEIEEARKTILARLELRGELPEYYSVVPVNIEPEIIAHKPPIVRQFVGFRHYLVGMLFMALNLRDRAIGRFQASA